MSTFAEKYVNYSDDAKIALNSIISQLNSLRQNFAKNKNLWLKMAKFREECASKITWIEKTQNSLSEWKSVDCQNYADILELYNKLNFEVKTFVEEMEKLGERREELNEMIEDNIFDILNQKWNSFLNTFEKFSFCVENIQVAAKCIEKIQIIFKEKKEEIYEYLNDKSVKNISDHENYLEKLNTFFADIKDVDKQIEDIQLAMESNASQINLHNFANGLHKIKDSLKPLYNLITECKEKETQLIKRFYEFVSCYKTLKLWIMDSSSVLSNEENAAIFTDDLDDKLSAINSLMKTKENEINKLKEKAEKFEVADISEINGKLNDIKEKWKNLSDLISEKNAENDMIKSLKQKTDYFQYLVTKTLAQKLNEIKNVEEFKEFLDNFRQLDIDIIDIETMADKLNIKYPKHMHEVGKHVENMHEIYGNLKNKTLTVAKDNFCEEKNNEFSNITTISQLIKHFNSSKNPDPNLQTSPRLKLRKSWMLDESFKTFWHNRRSRFQSFKQNTDKSFDDNWLKRMSKMPIFYIPQKYNVYDQNINAIGIDLGTSSCCVAVNRRDKIKTAGIENTGERTLPSYVGFNENHVKCGKVVVGHLGTHSKSTIFDSKMIIGKKFAEISVDPTWPFVVLEDGENAKLQVRGPSNNVITKTAEEVASILLLYIKDKAEEFQGKKVTTVVITIPASFTESQKEATVTAGKLAGFNEVNLLPEPVAASFAYFIDTPLPQNSTLFLFDLGGGTLDICIFEINNSAFQIIRNTGDANIGGRNFDKLLYEYFKNELLSRHKINVEADQRRKYRLMLKCQEIKEILSVTNDGWIDVDDYDSSKDEPPIKITREQFENMSMDLINDIKILLRYAIDGLQNEIQKVFLVGGSSRMPMIKNMLKLMFPNAKHCIEEHPEEVVATGAAYYAYHLAIEQSRKTDE